MWPELLKTLLTPPRYAGIQDSGRTCFCGAGYGRYGLGVCHSPCGDDSEEICGGALTNSVYQTNVNGEAKSYPYQFVKVGLKSESPE